MRASPVDGPDDHAVQSPPKGLLKLPFVSRLVWIWAVTARGNAVSMANTLNIMGIINRSVKNGKIDGQVIFITC